MSDHETTLRGLATDLAKNGWTPQDKLEAAACLAGADALRRGTWQPIETAPKDGTCVMLWDGEYVTQGSHFGGVWFAHGESDFTGPGWSPTHWQPFPDAPTEPTR